jgi:hypothetical protein
VKFKIMINILRVKFTDIDSIALLLTMAWN